MDFVLCKRVEQYVSKKCRLTESNRRHPEYKTGALPTELNRLVKMGEVGLEPTKSMTAGLQPTPFAARDILPEYYNACFPSKKIDKMLNPAKTIAAPIQNISSRQ